MKGIKKPTTIIGVWGNGLLAIATYVVIVLAISPETREIAQWLAIPIIVILIFKIIYYEFRV